MVGACNTHGRDENAYIILIGKPEGRRPLRRRRCRWEGDIRIDCGERRWNRADRTHVA
jgi:hypothetical protein